MMKKFLALLLCAMLSLACVFSVVGCGGDSGGSSGIDPYKALSGIDPNEEVTLNIAIPYKSDKGLNEVGNAFEDKYPNATVNIEYNSVLKEGKNAENITAAFIDNSFDILVNKGFNQFTFTVGEETKSTEDYVYNFATDNEIDFSYTTQNVMGNYKYTKDDVEYFYSVPTGGEVRGVFVNVSLLKEYGLSVPKNYTELVNCCKELKDEGIIAIQGNPSYMPSNFAIGEITSEILSNPTATEALKNADDNMAQYCEKTLKKLYDLTANGYYEYKTIEILNGMGNEDTGSKQFLGLTDVYQDGTWTLLDETDPNYLYSKCAFWPYLSSFASYIEAVKTEYELDTEYTFILSPLNDANENSKGYFTPYYGLVANKNSENLDWVKEFVNFFFYETNNILYADNNGIIPNNVSALNYFAKKYGVRTNDVTLCGEILFRDGAYNAWTPIQTGVQEFVKTNPQKYMVCLQKDDLGNVLKNADGSFVFYNDNDDKGNYLFLSNDSGAETATKVYEADISDIEYKTGYALRSFSYCINKFNAKFASYQIGD